MIIDLAQLTADAISYQRTSALTYKDARRYCTDARKWSFMPEAHARIAVNFQVIAAHDAYAARQALFSVIIVLRGGGSYDPV